MPKEYFFLYLVYGLVFIAMGIYASVKKEPRVQHLPIVRSLKYLGAFGVLHGLSEWITMLVITELYSDYYVSLFYLKQLLKATSFASLMLFGINILPINKKHIRALKTFPIILLFSWGLIISWLVYSHGLTYNIDYPAANNIIMRYFLSFTAGLTTAIAFYLLSKKIVNPSMLEIKSLYLRMALIIFIYAIVDGLFVREASYFPANIINNNLFADFFGLPIQFIKIATGIAINYLLVQIIATFNWEQKTRLQLLEKQRISWEERRKLGGEIHDGIIQSLYAGSLKLQSLQKKENIPDGNKQIISDVNKEIGNSIKRMRDFISGTNLEDIPFSDLESRIATTINTLNRSQKTFFSFSSLGFASDNEELMPLTVSTNIYYIVQESLNNIVKHAQSTSANVSIAKEDNRILIIISDNGRGFDYNNARKKSSIGLESMLQRADQIGANITFASNSSGTTIKLLYQI